MTHVIKTDAPDYNMHKTPPCPHMISASASASVSAYAYASECTNLSEVLNLAAFVCVRANVRVCVGVCTRVGDTSPAKRAKAKTETPADGAGEGKHSQKSDRP